MAHEMNRRQALAGLGTLSLGAVLAACEDEGTEQGATSTSTEATSGSATDDLLSDAPSCTLTPELTEGPYYFDADAIRSDIREGKEGVELALALRVRDAGSCEPIPNAVVDIWHCDALGNYSGFESAVGGPGGGGRSDDKTYLRGAQVTGRNGVAEFTTIYPGWYPGRTVHIHAKVHLDRATLLTTQLYFEDDISRAVYARQPYSARPGRDQFNDSDGIFDAGLVMKTVKRGEGYAAALSFDVEQA